MPHDDADSRRKRALRAARAVTLGMGMALAASGCSTSHSEDASVPDGGDAMADSSRDADADTGIDCSSEDWWDTEVCCEMSGGAWVPGGGCAVPGPFVPPAMA